VSLTDRHLNQYVQEHMGDDFTVKDFRTWGATLRAIALMAATPLPEQSSERALKTSITTAIKQVAEELRNTPAVCRKSYINPIVFTAWRNGSLQKIIKSDGAAAPRKAERLALTFLRREAKRATMPSGEPVRVRRAGVRPAPQDRHPHRQRHPSAPARPQKRHGRQPTRAAHRSAQP